MQTNLIVPQNIMSINEAQSVSRVSRWFVSPQNHAPMAGCFQDGLIGIAELTKANLPGFTKWHAMNLLAEVNTAGINYDFPGSAKTTFTNRSLVSRLLPKINITGKTPSIYKPQYANFLKYNPEDIKVNIIRGELQSGILDKATTGEAVPGSIFHIIADELGNEAALASIYDFQQICHRFFGYHGFTVGIADINISEPAMAEVKRKLATMILNSRKITQRLNNGKLIAPIGMSLSEFYENEQMTVLSPGDDFANPILADTDINSNQMAKLILTGSKGKLTNYISINGAICMQTINGKRIGYNQAGWGRTSPYFLRYDTEADANGFVSMSFREGVASHVYSFMAAEGRDGSISNALKTSVTGYQNRISIKNLESIITDNLRKSVKGSNVIQPIYAECGLDASKMKQVKFPTITMSDAEFESTYKTKVTSFPAAYRNKATEEALSIEYDTLKEDRDKFRRIHMTMEAHNPKEYVMTVSKQMPVDVFRVVENTVYNYSDVVEKISEKDKILDPIYATEVVKSLCDNLGYVFMNELQRNLKRKIPKYIVATSSMMCILIRSYLNTSYLLKKGVCNYLLDIIIQRILLMYKRALIDYGTSIGILAAQCVCDPMTQYMLDSKHRTGGGGGTKTNTIVRMQEILGAKPTENMKNPHMMIMVKPEYEKDKLKVQEIANHIEMMSFGQFVSDARIFFESYGKPIHEDFKHEAEMIRNFEKHNLGQKVPGDLAKWCVRFTLDKEEMILKSMKLETIILALRINHPELYIVYSPENADNVIVRCYLRNTMFKQSANYYADNVLYIMEEIKKVIVRGIKNIYGTSVIEVLRSEIKPDGSLDTSKVYAIYTSGTNITDVIGNTFIDPYRTQSDSIEETQRVFGITAARNKIINEMITAMDVLTRIHCSIFADEMCYTGQVSNIQKTGLQKRENANVTLRLSFQTAVQVIQDAAIHGLVDHISGISGPLVMGTNPNIGTTYNSIVVNRQFLEEKAKSLESIAEDL
jgi:DNA-directed RNA polymerase beta' subunit